ncbi:hypothetical protein ACHAXS_014229 [Conticribra weissflogii]
MTTVTDSNFIETELSKAKAELHRLQQLEQRKRERQNQLADKTLQPPDAAEPSDRASAVALFHRALRAQDEIHFLEIQRDVATLVSELVEKRLDDGADNATGTASGSVLDLLMKATETCTSLGLLLIRHPPLNNMIFANDSNHGKYNIIANDDNGKSKQLYRALTDWYNTLNDSSLQIAISSFSHQLRKCAPEFPSNARSSKTTLKYLQDPSSEFGRAARCLVELQIVKDALDLQRRSLDDPTPNSPEEIEIQRVSLFHLPLSWRWLVVDELCRPLAERLRFHFLEEQTGLVSVANASAQSKETERAGVASQKQNPSNMDRFPEWLFRYLKEVVDDHETHSIVMGQGLQPLVDSVMESLILKSSLVHNDFGLEDDDENFRTEHGKNQSIKHHLLQADEILQHLKQNVYSHSPVYFMREVSRMARHALRAKSFFHHPDVVGMGCSDRKIVLRGIEQLFLFDSFVDESIQKWADSELRCGDRIDHLILPPKLTDAFLSTNQDLLEWWITQERFGAIDALEKCASSTLSSYQSSKDKSQNSLEIGHSINKKGTHKSEPLYPAVCELFAALIYSGCSKSMSFSDHRSQQLYIAGVIAPLCSVFLDLIHAEASFLRKKLLSRPPSSTSSNILRSTSLLSDIDLKTNVSQWISVITGTHVAAQAVRRSQFLGRTIGNTVSFSPQSSSSSIDVMERLAQSIEKLRDAMLEDFIISAFVETIVMERAKFASYMMRCPFLLSQGESTERRGQREKDDGHGNVRIHWTLSPDLNDSFHVISIVVQSLQSNMRKLDDMFGSDNPGNLDGSNVGSGDGMQPNTERSMMALLSFGNCSVRSTLSSAISGKFMEIAVDPQGMAPEIRRGGAQQFNHDVLTFAELFDSNNFPSRFSTNVNPMERACAASRLMSAEPTQIQSLRNALSDLATPSSGIKSLFERRHDVEEHDSIPRLNLDDFYADERLVEEAHSMLSAKGYGVLELDEVISIINRIR